jgi:hypothetical protein
MATRMQQRRGTAAQWTAANPVLAAGEIGFETDTNKFKMGNGSSAWTALTYFANAAELAAIVDAAPETLNTLNEIAAAINDDPAFFTNFGTTVGQSIANSIETFRLDTTDIHGIANTANLATQTYVNTAVSTHESDTSVHGIANTADLVTQSMLSNAIDAAEVNQSALAGTGIDWNSADGRFDIDSTVATKTYADTAVSTHNSDATDVHGIADTSLLATKSYADTAEADAITAAGTAADTKISTAVAALTKSSVGLGNVDNTADASKPVSTAQATAIATAKSEAIADATSQVNALLTGAPAALNTLDELAAALGDDANFASTVTTSLGLKAPLASPTFTGTVTVAAAGVAFTDGTQTKEGVPSRTPIIQKTAAYTLSALTERDGLIEMGSASALTLTIPPASSVDYPVGTSIDILQTGAGQVTIAAGAGVTVNATPGLKLRTTWSSATLFKRAQNTWVVYGDLTA